MKKSLSANSIFIKVILSALPLLIGAAIYILYSVKKGIIATPVPVWNDEALYYSLVKTYISGGKSLGYWGYLGEHALSGTGNIWAPAIILPYAALGKIFGWHYYSVSLCNFFFLFAANLLFMLITKAEKKVCLRLIVCELLSLHIWLYIDSQMSELLRYAIAIVLAGMLCKLIFEKDNSTAFKVITGAFLVYAVFAYIFFVFAVFIYVYALLKEKKSVILKVLVSLLAMIFLAAAAYLYMHFTSSDYEIGKTEVIVEALKNHDIGGAISGGWDMIRFGFRDFFKLFSDNEGHGLFAYFVILVVAVIAASLVFVLKEKLFGKKNNKNAVIFGIILYTMLVYTLLYITLYSMEPFTVFRGMGMPIMFCLAMASGLEGKAEFIAYLAACSIMIAFLPLNLRDFSAGRFVSKEIAGEWDARAESFEDMIKISDENPENEDALWRNTVILYTMEPKIIASIPAGVGQNFMMTKDIVPDNAGYLLFTLREGDYVKNNWLDRSYDGITEANRSVMEENYVLLYRDEEYVIYSHRNELR